MGARKGKVGSVLGALEADHPLGGGKDLEGMGQRSSQMGRGPRLRKRAFKSAGNPNL